MTFNVTKETNTVLLSYDQLQLPTAALIGWNAITWRWS